MFAVRNFLKSSRISALKFHFSSNMATALAILPPGAEEIEFVASVDVLRRAGVTVTVAGVDGKDPVKCSRDVVIVPDVSLADAVGKSFDAIVMPGGLGGAKSMAESSVIKDLLKKQEQEGKLIAAICASPALVFKAHNIAVNKKITCYPSFREELGSDYTFVDEVVVQDGKIITSQGPSTVFQFALKIAENLVGAEKAESVAKGILLK